MFAFGVIRFKMFKIWCDVCYYVSCFRDIGSHVLHRIKMSRNYFEFRKYSTFAISQCMHFCFIGQSGAKILNITTQGGKIISTGAGRNPNVVTVNPKTLQLHAVKTPGSKHGKKLDLFLSSF
jgi:hypothetical protein